MIEELAWSPTAQGELTLRRRHDRVTDRVVLEIKLGDEFLMSSQFTAGEVELAHRTLAMLDDDGWDVVVGGLGLGYTACAALDDARVASLLVVEYSDAVIDWHQRHLVPNGAQLCVDPRTRIVCADFFAAALEDRLDPTEPGRRFDAVLLDIDHSPTDLLSPNHADFYGVEGLRGIASTLRPGGVFGLWSNEPPDPQFCDRLREVFTDVASPVIEFDNPLQQSTATNTIYLARGAAAPQSPPLP